MLIHTNCGGKVHIHFLLPICDRCKKRWKPWGFILASDMHMVVEARSEKKAHIGESRKHAKWADSIPGANVVPSILPNWPRWARLLSTMIVISLIGFVIWWFLIR
jgi:hypothetical protein